MTATELIRQIVIPAQAGIQFRSPDLPQRRNDGRLRFHA
jgi:hypothetical protein